MCGIIGIISRDNRDDIGEIIYEGLHHEQNRGDFSAGIATMIKFPLNKRDYNKSLELAVGHSIRNFDPMRIEKGHGPVSEVFHDKKRLERLVGYMGVGQVRYPTAGYTKINDEIPEEVSEGMRIDSIQPLYTSGKEKIVMVHNGDVHNFHDIIAYFNDIGLRQATYNDLEAILNVFSEELIKYSDNIPDRERVEGSVRSVFNRVKGTYNVLAAINTIGLVAFRDPEGRRPFFFGVKTDAEERIIEYAFASETIALEKMGFKGTSDEFYQNEREAYEEVLPGQMVFIDSNLIFHRDQIADPDPKPCPFEVFYFSRAPSFLNNFRVKSMRKKIIEVMWDRFKRNYEYEQIISDKGNTIISAVPRTGESAAIHLSGYSGIPYDSIIEKLSSHRIFMQPTQEDRDNGTNSSQFVFEEDVTGRNLIIVDDSIVRGTTLKHLVRHLHNVDARSVHLLITFPPITEPCHHAINFKTNEELVANNRTVDEIKRELGLGDNDTLLYATPEDMKYATGYRTMCDECYMHQKDA